jgi:electron transfer flavoprotein alpha/beta subunit
MLRIIVTIKQVPDTKDVEIDKRTGTLKREGVPSIVNPEDRNGVELALQLKEKYGAEVTVITMGPPQAKEALYEVLGMGADKAYLISDRAFAGADTLATAYTLARAIEKIGEFDLIIAGRQAIDGDTAQVGPQLAASLGIPQITYVKEVEYEDGYIKAIRDMGKRIETLKAPVPVLLTVLDEANHPRYPNFGIIRDEFEKDSIVVLTVQDMEVEPARIGMDGSPTWVNKTFSPERYSEINILEGSNQEIVKKLIAELKNKKVLEV